METNIFDLLLGLFVVAPLFVSLFLIFIPYLNRAEKIYRQIVLLRFKYNIPKSELPAYDETPLLFGGKKKKKEETDE